jgi:hypothetical protein
MSLGEHAITHILSTRPPRRERELEGISWHLIRLPFPGDLLIELPECVDFIHAAVEAGGRVLVKSYAEVVLCAYCKPYLFFLLPLYGKGRVIKCPSSSDVDPEDFCRGSGAGLERKCVDCPRESIARSPIDRTTHRRRTFLYAIGPGENIS